ncbi:hypothetical protein NMY22_g5094 [Coprinellus aureogranulatus]|nr:hypothetical protein NMY22_g5094 [Coprinellus aureogranulatus]
MHLRGKRLCLSFPPPTFLYSDLGSVESAGMPTSFRPLQQRRYLLLGVVAAILLLLLILPSQSDHFSLSKSKANGKPAPDSVVLDDDFELDIHAGNPTHVDKPVAGHPASPSSSKSEHGHRLQRTDVETTSPFVLKSLDSDIKVGAYTWGFNVLDKLYLRNGTFYVVTSDRSRLPAKEQIIERLRLETQDGEEDEGAHLVEFITPAQSKQVLGDVATVVSGVNFLILDTSQFLNHYYHFWGEVIIGAWRVYSTLALSKDTTALDKLPFPSRILMPFVDGEVWRDKARLNGPLLRLAFPDMSIEKSEIWQDWIRSDTTLVFERSVTVNRYAAHKSPLGSVWFKMIGTTMNLTAPRHYWEPVRKSIMTGLFGHAPEVADSGKPVSPPLFAPDSDRSSSDSSIVDPSRNLPIVTYISRQKTGRRLIAADHEGLVAALKGLEKEGLCILRIPVMERLSFKDQFAEIASNQYGRMCIGNGLTHQMFMPPSLRSTVFEVQYPGDWAFDYWMLARNLGHKHYMVRNDTLTTHGPEEWHEGVHFSEGFHSDNIPVYGPVVAGYDSENVSHSLIQRWNYRDHRDWASHFRGWGTSGL